jgi:hypothetical protein
MLCTSLVVQNAPSITLTMEVNRELALRINAQHSHRRYHPLLLAAGEAKHYEHVTDRRSGRIILAEPAPGSPRGDAYFRATCARLAEQLVARPSSPRG